MQTKKRKGISVGVPKEGSLSVTDRVSAPDGTDLTNWEELPEAEARELERVFNEKKDTNMDT